MVGLLNAPKHTRFYKWLEAENRLTNESNGNNTDLSLNFILRMNYHELMNGYQKIIHDIYTTKPYYKRIRRSLLNYQPNRNKPSKITMTGLIAMFKSIYIIGILNKGRRAYWKLLMWTLFRRPVLVVEAVTFSIYGYHFRKVYGLQD